MFPTARTRPRFDTRLLDDESWLLLALAGERPDPGPRWVAPWRDDAADEARIEAHRIHRPQAAWQRFSVTETLVVTAAEPTHPGCPAAFPCDW